MSVLSFALVGCGRMGAVHADIIHKLDVTSLKCVHDADEAKAVAVSQRLGAKVAGSVEEAITAPGVDAVLVASATDTHTDIIEACARAGKPVLCEKPVGTDIGSVRKCREVLADNPVPVHIGFNKRFDAAHMAVRQALRDGEVGDVMQLVLTSRSTVVPSREYHERSGGLLRDMTVHDFDLFRFLLREEPASVFAVVGRQCDPELMDELGDHDTAMAILRTDSGVCCHINNSRVAAYGYDQRVEVLGSKCMLLSDNGRRHSLERSTAHATEVRAPLQRSFIERYRQAYEDQTAAFADAIVNGRQPPTTFDDGLRALEIAEAACQSVESGAMAQIPHR